MTSAGVVEIPKTGYVSNASAPKNESADLGVQFSEAMQFAADNRNENSFSLKNADDSNAQPYDGKDDVRASVRREIRNAEQTSNAEKLSDEQISEKIAQTEEEIVDEVARQLGVSEEEVVQALEILGISAMDLLVQGNLAALTAELTGMQTIDVLTEEGLFTKITELSASISDDLQAVADSLGMDMQELMQEIESYLDVSKENRGLLDESELVLSEIHENAEIIQGQNEEPMDDVDENVPFSKENVKPVEKEETENADVVETKEGTFLKKENAEFMQKDDGNETAYAQQGNDMQKNTLQSEPVKYADYDWQNENFDLDKTKEMISQISDYVRLHHSQRISSMEIQLHPVELGTVNLEVVAKDGNVSARIVVLEEAVRSALESQAVLLKETLQAQGMKIDAIEVTVAAHEFEQNLDQHGESTGEKAGKEKKSTRRILDLNELGTEEMEQEEISEAERLQIEMMRMGGNRMNFRV